MIDREVLEHLVNPKHPVEVIVHTVLSVQDLIASKLLFFFLEVFRRFFEGFHRLYFHPYNVSLFRRPRLLLGPLHGVRKRKRRTETHYSRQVFTVVA